MGWMGDIKQVRYVLDSVHADKDPDGAFHIEGGVYLFMGVGPDVVVGDDVWYFVDGQRKNLAAMMNSTSYGVREIKVF